MSQEETARCYYTAMRLELNQHLQIVNQIYTLYLGGVAALFAASLTREGKFNLLLLVPFLSLGAVNLISSHERTISCIAAYCADKLDPVLNRDGLAVTQWDKSHMLDALKKDIFSLNRLASLVLVVMPGIAALAIGMSKFYSIAGWPRPQYHPWILAGWMSGVLCLSVAIVIVILTLNYRTKMANDYCRPLFRAKGVCFH